LAPSLEMKTSAKDLQQAIDTGKEPVGPIFKDYLDGIFHELEKTQPDFSKYSELDEAIYQQIVNGERITYRFIEASLVASRYNNREGIFAIYEYFGRFIELYDISEKYSGSDGNKFLIYEMFVTFIASLIKYDRWEIIGDLLSKKLFVDKRDGYVRFEKINSYVRALDQIRDDRLGLRRCSITGDLIKDRFSTGHLSKILPHKEFLEADYLLFLRSIIDDEDSWRPASCIYFGYRVPSLMRKSVDYNFALNLLKTFNLKQISELKEKIAQKNHLFRKAFSQDCTADNPLSTFDIDTIGSINNPEKS